MTSRRRIAVEELARPDGVGPVLEQLKLSLKRE
jgi:hypothetical protein